MEEAEFKFTEQDWKEEMDKINFCRKHEGFGSCNLSCPDCGTISFYGPRGRKEEGFPRKYRACKFCGFWQEAFGKVFDERGNKPYRCNMILCNNCSTYSWREPWSKIFGHCENCSSEDLKQVKWPTEDASHPFNKIKAEIERIHNQK